MILPRRKKLLLFPLFPPLGYAAVINEQVQSTLRQIVNGAVPEPTGLFLQQLSQLIVISIPLMVAFQNNFYEGI